MIGEVISGSYDGIGKLVSQPSKKRHGFFKPTFPMGTYVSQPLATKCNSLEEIRLFLTKCRYVSDQEQFNRAVAIGYDARFVSGLAGRYGSVHAWVHFTDNGRTFLVEPTAARLGPKLPRLSTLRYQPRLSVAWDGKRLQYYEHEKGSCEPTVWEMIIMVGEWLPFWIRTRSKGYYGWARYFMKRGIDKLKMPN